MCVNEMSLKLKRNTCLAKEKEEYSFKTSKIAVSKPALRGVIGEWGIIGGVGQGLTIKWDFMLRTNQHFCQLVNLTSQYSSSCHCIWQQSLLQVLGVKICQINKSVIALEPHFNLFLWRSAFSQGWLGANNWSSLLKFWFVQQLWKMAEGALRVITDKILQRLPHYTINSGKSKRSIVCWECSRRDVDY